MQIFRMHDLQLTTWIYHAKSPVYIYFVMSQHKMKATLGFGKIQTSKKNPQSYV